MRNLSKPFSFMSHKILIFADISQMFSGIGKVIYLEVIDGRIIHSTAFLKHSINIVDPKQIF